MSRKIKLLLKRECNVVDNKRVDDVYLKLKSSQGKVVMHLEFEVRDDDCQFYWFGKCKVKKAEYFFKKYEDDVVEMIGKRCGLPSEGVEREYELEIEEKDCKFLEEREDAGQEDAGQEVAGKKEDING